jgi:hypothetical protein
MAFDSKIRIDLNIYEYLEHTAMNTKSEDEMRAIINRQSLENTEDLMTKSLDERRTAVINALHKYRETNYRQNKLKIIFRNLTKI